MRFLIFKTTPLKNEIIDEKFSNPYSPIKRVWHETFESAKSEAERLCVEKDRELIIFGVAGRIKPAPKTIFEEGG